MKRLHWAMLALALSAIPTEIFAQTMPPDGRTRATRSPVSGSADPSRPAKPPATTPPAATRNEPVVPAADYWPYDRRTGGM